MAYKRRRKYTPARGKRRRFRRSPIRRSLGFRRRFGGRYRTQNIRGWGRLGGFPNRMGFKHTYTAQKSLVSEAFGAQQEQVFRLNGMHDPDQSGTGNQPNFYDDLATYYRMYRVKGCLVRVCMLPNSLKGTPNTGNKGTRVVIHAGESNVAYNTVATLSERALTPLSKEYCLPTAAFGHANYGGSMRPIVFQKYYSMAKFHKDQPRKSSKLSAESGGAGSTSANPEEQVYFWIQAQQIDGIAYGVGAGSDYNLHLQVHLTYYTEWSEPVMTAYNVDT